MQNCNESFNSCKWEIMSKPTLWALKQLDATDAVICCNEVQSLNRVYSKLISGIKPVS